MTLFTTIVGIAQIIGAIGVLTTIVLNKDRIFNEISLFYKFLIDKNQSMGSKINHLKKQILLSFVEIVKVGLLLASGILSVYYMKLSDSCRFKLALYSTAIPNLPDRCKSITDMNLFWVSFIFIIYFFCLLYVFGYVKKEPKKMDEDFVPYPIKIENEKK